MPAVSGLVRTMAVSPRVHLANPKKNAEEIASLLRTADAQGVQLCVFPQLCLTGSTCGDLFAQPMLLDGAKEALAALLALPVKTAFVVGLPLVIGGRLYNCSAVVCAGKLALVPTAADSHLFADGASAPQSAMLFGQEVPVGTDLLIDCGSFTFSITDGSSASMAVAAQALIAVHPDAQNETCGRHSMRRRAALQHSEDGLCGYVYAGAGYGESTTDMVFSGYAGVCEEGVLLAENERFARVSSFAIADIDADRLRYRRIAKRRRHAAAPQKEMRSVCMQAPGYPAAAQPLRPLGTLPFVPDNDDDMRDILMIMTQGLIMRMEHIGLKKAVLGVSGGLDSTLTLLAAAFAFDRAGWDRKNIVGITMPGMGTGKRTKGNAEKLMELIGCTALEIPIGASVAQHFADIGQDPDVHDICYENSQARERTQIIMDYANKIGGLVLGTGDLSEIALGWCTYNGDHMSMYNMSGSIPKTLIRSLSHWAAVQLGENVTAVVQDILDTPISPELIPGKEGELTQRTEDTLGAYPLNDFFLYHMMDGGASPAKLYAMACFAFKGQYAPEAILKTLRTFVWRFFTQQFKRSALPDGPAVGEISLSPRGAWAMPSDAQMQLWLDEVKALQ